MATDPSDLSPLDLRRPPAPGDAPALFAAGFDPAATPAPLGGRRPDPPVDLATAYPVPAASPPITRPTDLAEVQAACRAQILRAGVGGTLAPDVFFRQDLRPFPDNGGVQVVLARGRFAPVASLQRGAGRYGAAYVGEIRVAIHQQSDADQAGREDIRLLGDLAAAPGVDPGPGTFLGSRADPGADLAAVGTGVDPESGQVAPGLERLAHEVIDALTLDFLEDAAGNHLTIEPVRVAGIGEPVPDPAAPGWGGITLAFEFLYLARLTLPAVTP